jgi:predicted dehydrogenase
MRFAVIGLGQRVAAVLSALKTAGASFELDGYYDPEPVGLARLAAEGIAVGEAYRSAEQALTSAALDLVMIGSPNHLHGEHLMLALYGKAPVFAEKPIVRTENESYALAQRLAHEETPDLLVGLVLRSAPIVREILDIVHEGHLGQIVSIDATEHLPPEHGAYLARNWRRKREWGGSYLLDKVCHDFDILGETAQRRSRLGPAAGARRLTRSSPMRTSRIIRRHSFSTRTACSCRFTRTAAAPCASGAGTSPAPRARSWPISCATG